MISLSNQVLTNTNQREIHVHGGGVSAGQSVAKAHGRFPSRYGWGTYNNDYGVTLFCDTSYKVIQVEINVTMMLLKQLLQSLRSILALQTSCYTNQSLLQQ